MTACGARRARRSSRTRAASKGEGVVDAQVSFAAGKGRIDYDPRATDLDELMQRVTKLGYTPTLSGDEEDSATSAAEERMLIQVLVAFAFGMQEMVLYIVRLYPAYSAGDYSSTQVRMVQVLAAASCGAGALLRRIQRSCAARSTSCAHARRA